MQNYTTSSWKDLISNDKKIEAVIKHIHFNKDYKFLLKKDLNNIKLADAEVDNKTMAYILANPFGCIDEMQFLLKNSPDSLLKVCSHQSTTPLHGCAVFSQFKDFLISVFEQIPESVNLLDAYGHTYLHVAAQKNIFEPLILKAINTAPKTILLPDKNGNTCLHFAGELGVMEDAINYAQKKLPGCETIKNNKGFTCIDLLQKGLKSDRKTQRSHDITFINFLYNNEEENKPLIINDLDKLINYRKKEISDEIS